MKIDKSAKVMYCQNTAGAVINAVPVSTIAGTAHSGHRRACVGFEAGATPLTGEATRKGGSRVYVKLTCNRGDLKAIPVKNEDGQVIGVEIAASGDDAGIALAVAIREIAENLTGNM